MEAQPTAARATLRTVINCFLSCFKYSQKLKNRACASLASFMQGGEREQPKSDTQGKTKTMLLRTGLWAASDPQQQQDQHPAPWDASGHTAEHQLQLWPWAASRAAAWRWPQWPGKQWAQHRASSCGDTEATWMHASWRTLSHFCWCVQFGNFSFPPQVHLHTWSLTEIKSVSPFPLKASVSSQPFLKWRKIPCLLPGQTSAGSYQRARGARLTALDGGTIPQCWETMPGNDTTKHHGRVLRKKYIYSKQKAG